jgi:hypothetical protein
MCSASVQIFLQLHRVLCVRAVSAISGVEGRCNAQLFRSLSCNKLLLDWCGTVCGSCTHCVRFFSSLNHAVIHHTDVVPEQVQPLVLCVVMLCHTIR